MLQKQKQKSEMKTIKNPTKQKQNQRNAKISIQNCFGIAIRTKIEKANIEDCLWLASCRMQYAENIPCNLLFWHFAYSKQFLWSFRTEKSVAMLGAPSCDVFFIVFEPGIEFFLSDWLEIALLG